ncbi:hypothetical protein ACQEVF_44060 [Nonomuraea polychroma]|uniref:hypothetical protein n=1 Tax=Nonomuraea polychroma TaxID=46176 RepID=UPI003D90844B
MSITVLLEILAGILLIFSALISAAALWVPPPRRSHAVVRRRASSHAQPVEDRPEWPGMRRLRRTPSPATPPLRHSAHRHHQQRDSKLEPPAQVSSV